ncbi:EAL domain-containing protein [Calidifontibacillus erzurumensis]|uniref:EAL domain-containing protein n=1 Tax=Calidifontibacillus erzurumensis TaxID=2741433 RepID=A0A8J8GG00_9BACI|nr:EAL domain-containing protein [Calidifontibacillus erzurumensis]NSL51620.1 EAL domain-containing protein [Calidifontibacillus erzurumensis]
MSTTLALEKLIEEDRFYHYSQALYNTKDWSKIGAEIYLRSEFGEADMIFRQAKIVNKLFELETKSISKVLQTFFNEEILITYFLFINIFPSTILHQSFPSFINKMSKQFNSKRQMIVFEIVNTDYVENFLLLKERINLLKDLGYLIAIDEIGKGWSSLDMIIELEPNFIKLDQFFSRNLSSSDKKQQMIKSLIQYAHHVGIKVILTGIEHETDLSIAKLLGVDICQGYLLAQPKPLLK